MTTTSSRTLQWIIIILIVTLISGGVYHYFTVRAAKINTSPTTLNTSGLVGYWTFDGADTPWTSTTAATTLDTSGQNNTGTLTNMSQSTSPTIGKIGQGLNFDGSNDYVNVGTSLDFTSPFTMTAWIKPKTVSTGVSVYDGDNIIHKGGAASDPPYNKQLTLFGTNELGWFSETASTNYVVITTGDAIIVNTWQLVTAVYNGTNMTLYVNGIAKGGPTAIEAPSAGSENVYLGGQTGGLGTSFDGTIDDVRIYNRALSIAEVEDLYRMGTATVNASTNALNTSGLVGQWSFDGKQTVWTSSTAATTLDTSGQGNTGTLTNMSQSTSPVVGKIGQALQFNGTNQYVSVPYTNTDFERTDPFSISVWAKWNNSNAAQSFIGKFNSSLNYRGIGFGQCKTATATYCNANSVYLWLQGPSNVLRMSTATNSVSPNVWTHVTVTYDGSSTASGVKIYVNGVSMALTTHGSGLASSIKASINWRIGDDYTDDWFSGNMDDVRIYNRALSAGEVAGLYTMGTATVNASTNALNTNGLVGQWSFDGKQTVWTSTIAATTLDTSGQSNTGTLTNMSQSTSPTPGKIGQALLFDGVDDYVTTGNAGDIKTLSYWVNTNTNKFYATPYVGTDFYKDGVSASLLGSELITNGNFDSDVTGWSVDSASPISWVNGTSGDGSTGYLRFSTADNGNWDRFRKDGSVVSASTTYQVSFWYRTSGITGNLDVHLTDNFGGLTNRVRSVPITPTSGSWKYFSVVLTTESSTYPIFTIVKLGNVGVGTFDIDAISVKTLNASIGTGWHHIVTTSNNGIYASNMSIGKSQGTSEITGGYWTGSIDDVRVYNKALSADEVASLYNQGR